MRTIRKWISPALLAMLLHPGAVVADGPDVVPLSERARYLMGTLCEARAFGDPASTGRALDAALDRISELEEAMTTYREDGGLARLNRAFASGDAAAGVPISEDLFAALDAAVEWARITDGRFDPTIGSILDVWGTRHGGREPSDSELDAAIERTSWRLLELDRAGRTARALVPGLALDLGGFGKGYALDAAAGVLRDHGVESALINFGGQVLAIGTPPGEPGWIVEIADPLDRTRPAAELRVRDASVATSGNAERSFLVDGRRYGHLFDPRTGRPVERRGSSTVVAARAAEADVLATALVVAGPARAQDLFSDGAEFLYLEASEPGVLVGHAEPRLRLRLTTSVRIAWHPTFASTGSQERTGP